MFENTHFLDKTLTSVLTLGKLLENAFSASPLDHALFSLFGIIILSFALKMNCSKGGFEKQLIRSIDRIV